MSTKPTGWLKNWIKSKNIVAPNIEKILIEVEKLSASEKKQLINALLGKYFLPKSEEEDESESESDSQVEGK